MDPLAGKEFTLEDLPMELLFEIVGFLGTKDLISMTRVSRKLREISWNPRFWKKIHIDVAKHSFKYAKLISGHCPLLRKLSFCSETELVIVVEGFTYGQKEMQGYALDLIYLFGKCEFLEKLDFGKLEVADKMAKYISSSFPRLKELRINEGGGMKLEGLIDLSKLEHLRKLYLLKTRHLYQNVAALKFLAENFKNIQELGLHLSGIDKSAHNAAFIRVLESHGDKLKQLSLNGNGLSTKAYKKLVKCKNLEDLELWFNDMEDSDLAILEGLGNLRRLRMIGDYDEEARDLVNSEHLVDSEGLLQFFNRSASLFQLESLELSETFLCDEGLASIAKNCPNLRHLRLQDCCALSVNYYRIILENFQQLESLELADMSEHIPRKLLFDIPTKLPNLRKFGFVAGYYSSLDEAAVNRLKELAPHLEVTTK